MVSSLHRNLGFIVLTFTTKRFFGYVLNVLILLIATAKTKFDYIFSSWCNLH